MKDKQYWMTLTERFFEAQTSEQDEHALRRFAAVTDDPDFDELRAVMGYAAASRPRSAARHRLPLLTPIQVAAAVLLVAGLSLCVARMMQQPPSDCIAYVNGERITDEAQVFELMTKTMSSMSTSDDESDLLESQQEMMFNDR